MLIRHCTTSLTKMYNKRLVEAIKESRYSNWRVATLIEDIQSICNLFHQCSFSFLSSGKVDNIKLSMHTLNIWLDEEWVNPTLRC